MSEIREDLFGNRFCSFYKVSRQQSFDVFEKELETPVLYRVKYSAYHDGTWPRVPNCFVYILRSVKLNGKDVVYVGESEQGGKTRPTSHEDKGVEWDYCYVMTVSTAMKAVEMTTDVLLTLEDRLRDYLDDDERYLNTTKKTQKVVLDERQKVFVDKYLTVVLDLLDLAGMPIGLRRRSLKGTVKTDEGRMISIEEAMKSLSEEEELLQERLKKLKNGERAEEVIRALDDDFDQFVREYEQWKASKRVLTPEELAERREALDEINEHRRAILMTLPEDGYDLEYSNPQKRSRCRATLYYSSNMDATKGVRFILRKGSVLCPEECFSKKFKTYSEYRAYRRHVELGNIVNGVVIRDIEVYPSHASSWCRGCTSNGYSDWRIVNAEITLSDYLG